MEEPKEWPSVFDNALDFYDASVSASSECGKNGGSLAQVVSPSYPRRIPSIEHSDIILPNLPRDIDIGEADSYNDFGATLVDFSEHGAVVFKVTGPDGRTRQIQ